SILFLSVYLLSTTQFSQILKLPILVEHFIEHRAIDSMSFWGFLVHHYDNHQPDEDYETDMKLPFMVHNDVLKVAVDLNSDSPYLGLEVDTYDGSKNPSYFKLYLKSAYLSAI